MSPKHFIWNCSKFIVCGLLGLLGLLGMVVCTVLTLEALFVAALLAALLGFALMIVIYADGIKPALDAEDRAEASIRIRRE